MENDKYPLVSVIMATYNENPSIVFDAIESILNQTYSNFELLIMDDSTNKETINCIDKVAVDSRIKVIRKDKRMGLSGARNVGLEAANGKYIAIMDGDDISLPSRLEKQVDYLELNPKCFVLGGQMNIIDEEGTIVSKRQYPTEGIKLKLFAAIRNPIAHPTVMFRRELYDLGFLYDENLEMSEDLDLWLRIMNSGYEIKNLNDTIINYRVDSRFIEKRTSDRQKEYMAYVRKKNWSNSHIPFSVLSVFAGQVFKKTPSSALASIYKKENN